MAPNVDTDSDSEGFVLTKKSASGHANFQSVFCAVQPRVSWRDVGLDGFDICVVPCYVCNNVWFLSKCAQRNEKESTTRQTLVTAPEGLVSVDLPWIPCLVILVS